jgi:hypothetical protein
MMPYFMLVVAVIIIGSRQKKIVTFPGTSHEWTLRDWFFWKLSFTLLGKNRKPAS